MKKKIKNRIGGIALVGIAAFAGGAAGYFGMEALSKEGFYGAGMFAMLAALVVSLYLSMFIHVLIHEGGHLVMGLAAGYGFLSYRAGSHIWVKKGDKIVRGRFQMPGTAGQCLLKPSENRNGKESSAFLYNLGGGLFNLIGAALAAAAAFCLNPEGVLPTAAFIFLICFALVGIYLGVVNLIPLKVGGVPNDGYNMRHLAAEAEANEYFNMALKMYEAQCMDKRNRELPDELFSTTSCRSADDAARICEKGNALEIGVLESFAEKLFDERRFIETEEICTVMRKSPNVPEIYKIQADMLRTLICMVTGRPEEAAGILERKSVRKTLSASRLMPNTACIEYGRALLIQGDESKAAEWKKRFDRIERTYPFKADYAGYLEILKKITVAGGMETERLVLRNWRESDAEDLYLAAKNPNVGPLCGWNPHRDAGESLDIIRSVLNSENCFALVLKETGKAIGSIELMIGKKSSLCADESEAELGYWLSEDYWGRGLMPEAANKIIDYGFSTLHLDKIWCAARSYNSKSLRVQEKCGFKYVRTDKGVTSGLTGDVYDRVVNCLHR